MIARIRGLLRPPRIVAVTRRPAGWFVVGRRRLHDVIAWALYDDGRIVGLVAGRRGLRPAVGRRFRGYLPAAPHSAGDVQLSPPAVSMPVGDLKDAIGDVANLWMSESKPTIFERLKIAAENEWATEALRNFIAGPDRFLRRYLELLAEHAHPAELDAEWGAGPASITKPPARAGIREENEA